MTGENFDYNNFAEKTAAQIPFLMPDGVKKDEEEFLTSIIRTFISKSGKNLCEDEQFVDLSTVDIIFYLHIIGKYTFSKGLSLIYAKVPKKYWNRLLQNVAFIVFELIKSFIEDNTSQEDILEEVYDAVEDEFRNNIDKLVQEEIITKDIAVKAKECSIQPIYSDMNTDDEMLILLNANGLMFEGKYLEATKYYDKMIALYPDTIEYYYYKAICLYNLNDYKNAVEVYKKIFSKTGDENLLDTIAYCDYLSENYTEAISCYGEYLNYLESEADVNLERSDYYAENGDEETSEIYKQAYNDLQIGIEKTYVMIANCYYASGDYTNAMKNYDYVLELNPQCFEAIFAKAEWYRQQKCYNAALERYFSLPDVKDNEIRRVILTNIAFCYDEMKQHDVALDYYERVLELDPQSGVALFNKASCLFELQEYSKAIQLIQESIEFGFENLVDAYRMMIYCYIYEESYAEAVEYCNRILELDPENAEALLNKGDCYLRQHEINKAMHYLQRALDNNVEDKGRAYTALGDCYSSYNEDYEEACEYYNKAINEILSNNDVTDNLAVSDDYKKGLAYAYYAKGNCLLKCAKSYDEAFMCFMRAIDYGYDREECEEKINEIKRNWG